MMEAKNTVIGTTLIDIAKRSFKAGKQEGREEVVEWVNSKPIFMQHSALGIKTPIQVVPEWEVKLKEWGIEQKDDNR